MTTAKAPLVTGALADDAARLLLLDQLRTERFGVAVARCFRCAWTTTRPRRDYALSALLAHDEHHHVTELDKRRRQTAVNAEGRAAALATLAGRITA